MSAAAQAPVGEIQLKAAFLYRFAAFVEWPNTPPQADVLNLCVVGDPEMRNVVERAVQGQRVVPRQIVVRNLAEIAPRSGCQIAYLRSSTVQSAAEALRLLSAEPILTVTDAASSSDARGIIHFQISDNRLRFHIDDREAARRGLEISSRLLDIALSVRRRS